jgi:hypothetical protein
MNYKKINEEFLERFISLESLCAEKLGVVTAGITEYISRLNSAKSADGRDEALRQLNRYRSLRNRLVHENKALKSMDEINKTDIKWLKNFEKLVKKKKDPLSRYYKKAKGSKRRKIFFTVLIILAILGLLVGAYFLFF